MNTQQKTLFDTVIASINKGREMRQDDLVALLTLESQKDRFTVNSALAHVYLQNGRLEQAAIFADRAWLLANGNFDFFPAYLEIHKARGDLERIRSIYKQAGMHLASLGNVPEALRYFNLYHYAYQSAGQGDRYDYDFDILHAVEALAQPYQSNHRSRSTNRANRKIKLAYLVFGASHSESVLIKLLCYFAQYHDADRFTVRFFVPENIETAGLYAIPQLQSNLPKLAAAGALVETPQAQDELGNLVDIAAKMADFQPDLLISTAALADYAHYFLVCTKPASAQIGLVYGPPEQYVAPEFDWVIAATKHPLIDSPCDGTVVPVEVNFPNRSNITIRPRSDFHIPDDATVIVIVGRPEKFINQKYWQMLSDVLLSTQNTFLLVVGIDSIPDSCLQNISSAVLPRLQLIGYQKDYLRTLAMADIVLDTFPSGGGIVLLDAMALSIPIVTFRNDYSRKFDQTQWSPAEELFDVEELITPRGDFNHYAAIIKKLISDPHHREDMGRKCRASVLRLNGQPERMVRRCEEVYSNVLQRSLVNQRENSPKKIVAHTRNQWHRTSDLPFGSPKNQSIATRILIFAHRRFLRIRHSIGRLLQIMLGK